MSVQADPSNQADPPAPGVEIALDSLRLRVGDHVGVFYRGMEECQAVVLPLIDEALAAGCGVIYVSDHDTPEEIRRQLLAEAIDADAATARGQLRLVPSTDAYLPGVSSSRIAPWSSTSRRRRKASSAATRFCA